MQCHLISVVYLFRASIAGVHCTVLCKNSISPMVPEPSTSMSSIRLLILSLPQLRPVPLTSRLRTSLLSRD